MLRRQFLSPARAIVLGFLAAMVLGALALMLPGVVAPGHAQHNSLDALFQATSAVCVTGLAVRDLADYTWFGQFLILLLIQVGGLGILTTTKLLLLTQGRDLRLGDRDLVDATFGSVRQITPREVLRQTMLFTLGCEVLGILALAPVFIADHGWSAGLWAAVFHSISAFCNAGFSLWSDNLGAYRAHGWVNGVICALVIAGGLGFVVVAELVRYLRNRRAKPHGRRERLSLHSRTVLVTSLLLIVGGTAVILVLEVFNSDTNTFAGDGLAAFFLSTSSRTAGFTTAPIDALSQPSLLILMILMFIGGSPGSTAGGVKTTTLATLVALVFARTRGRSEPELSGRTIGSGAVGKALATTAFMVSAVIVGTISLEIVEVGGSAHRAEAGPILDHAFEVVSALCTVGLSTGITTELSPGGRFIIICCMIVGRLGPPLIAGAILARNRPHAYVLPHEDLVIG